MAEEKKKLSIPELRECKKAGRKLAMALIPDYSTAVWAERASLDIAAFSMLASRHNRD